MQGQSSPAQVKRSLHRFYPHACRLILQTHRSVQCTPPKNNQKLVDGSNKKTKQTNKMPNNHSVCGVLGYLGIFLEGHLKLRLFL